MSVMSYSFRFAKMFLIKMFKCLKLGWAKIDPWKTKGLVVCLYVCISVNVSVSVYSECKCHSGCVYKCKWVCVCVCVHGWK